MMLFRWPEDACLEDPQIEFRHCDRTTRETRAGISYLLKSQLFKSVM